MTEIEYIISETWNKKLDMECLLDLHRADFPGWDRDHNGELMYINVDLIWPSDDKNPQREMIIWADDNCEGYFHLANVKTEGGTPIVRPGDKVSIALIFQLKKDAFAFKLRWL